MIWPVRSLTVLAAVLSELALSARTKIDIGYEAVGIAWVLPLLGPRIVHFKAPAAVFGHSKHVNYGDERVTL